MRVKQGWSGEIAPNQWAKVDLELEEEDLRRLLAAAGLPDVVRDPFEEQAWPDDRFGLVPRTLRDLDPDLAAIHFAWGIAKVALLRARAERSEHRGPPR
jgi:hypothetical protein